MVHRAISIALLLASALVLAGEQGGLIQGRVYERGTRRPLGGVMVFAVPSPVASGAPVAAPERATTGSDGAFEIRAPGGPFTWVVNRAGYVRLQKPEDPSETGERALYLARQETAAFETTVYGHADKRDDKARTLTQAQFLQLPGSGGDPVKAVQNLPGVGRPAGGFTAQVVIEGSAPEDTNFAVEGHGVPLLFHFGGLSSVVMPEAVERVDYLSAGFGPEWGGALGGVISLRTRAPQTDRLHLTAYVDIFNAGALIETPVGAKTSVLLAARKTYIGPVLERVLAGNPDFNLTAAPDFADVTAIVRTELTHRDELQVTVLGSQDTLGFVLKEPARTDPSIRGSLSNRTEFFRVIPRLTHRHSSRTVSRWSLSVGKDWVSVENPDFWYKLQEVAFASRGEVERQMTPAWKSIWGTDNSVYWESVAFRLPVTYAGGGVSNPFSTGNRTTVSFPLTTPQYSVYWRNILHPEDSSWTLSPGFRVEYFGVSREWVPEPRLGLKLALGGGLTLRAAGGYYGQPPQDIQIYQDYGNPDLKSARAWHATIGGEKDFRGSGAHGWVLSGDFFYRAFSQLAAASTRSVERAGSTVPEIYNNDGRGRAFGVATLLKAEFPRWGGWLAYTLSRSTRWTTSDTAESLFQYDQTHLLTLVAQADLGLGWKVSGRVRYVSGNPYTPVIGGDFDADNDVYLPRRGATYSKRMDPFIQVDVRLDKKWVFEKWILSAYLDVQNALNRENPEALTYSYDYQTSAVTSGLPILPMLGVKGEF